MSFDECISRCISKPEFCSPSVYKTLFYHWSKLSIRRLLSKFLTNLGWLKKLCSLISESEQPMTSNTIRPVWNKTNCILNVPCCRESNFLTIYLFDHQNLRSRFSTLNRARQNETVVHHNTAFPPESFQKPAEILLDPRTIQRSYLWVLSGKVLAS